MYRFKGERVEDALYRDYQKRQARAKLLIESVIQYLTPLFLLEVTNRRPLPYSEDHREIPRASSLEIRA